MRAVVDEEACTACGLCEETCPEVFVLEDDVAKVIVEEVPSEAEDACREAAEDCPVDAIALEDQGR
jgi:ferredoxin